MQSLGWYRRRLLAMSPAELAWRLRGKVRDGVDRCLRARRQTWANRVDLLGDGQEPGLRPKVVGLHLPTGDDLSALGSVGQRWHDTLIARADRICENRITLFDLEEHPLGEPINWNREYKADKTIPLRYADDLDYRDHAECGDCKFAWELSRFQHLVALGRAYRLTGHTRYAVAGLAQIDSWLVQCPYGLGMQWRSPLELGIRLINWVWGLELIRPSGAIPHSFWRRLLPVVDLHVRDLARKYSRFSSANNHLIGEAAGVFIASSYFTDLPGACRQAQQSRDILIGEILNQTYADGCTREQALGYHLFVLQFLVIAGLAARGLGEDFPATFWNRLERMFEFLHALCEGGDEVPQFGDCDDGYVLDLSTRAPTPQELLAVGAVLFNRPDFKVCAHRFSEPAFWLLGPGAQRHYEALEAHDVTPRIRSRACAESGYYLLQSGSREDGDLLSVLFDCGELGFGAIAAHGHADALSITLRSRGREMLVDPGTYDYFTYPAWRDYFRSTRAHNTITVDDRDQSEMLGPFLWGHRASTRRITWQPVDTGGSVSAEHDGYARFPANVIHRRTVTLDGARRRLVVQDELTGEGRHQATIYFHLAPDCTVTAEPQQRYRASWNHGTLTLSFPDNWHIDLIHGSEDPIFGWVSRAYHRKEPATTVIGRAHWEGTLRSEVLLEVS